MGNTALNGGGVTNKIAQSVYSDELTYDIGNVYIYLYGPYGDVSSGYITLDICETDSGGKPTLTVASQTISTLSVETNGWYKIEFNISGATPSNKYLSYVVSMTGMDEDNYVIWGNNGNDTGNDKAFILVNDVWEEQPNTIRGLKTTRQLDVFDLENHRLNSSPGVLSENIPTLNGNSASYDATQFLTSPDRVELKNPDALISFVIDSSGSMGWADRKDNRTDLVNSIYNRFKDNYSGDFLFDYIKFGAVTPNLDSFRSSIGTTVTINLDINRPTRTTYSFVLSGELNAFDGDVYKTADDKEFTVLDGGNYITVLKAVGGSATVVTSGTLEKVSGTGDATLAYTSVSAASIGDGIIAYGLKNLAPNNTYIIGELMVNDNSIDSPSLVNWHLFNPSSSSPTLSLGNSGPHDSSAVEINTAQGTVARKTLDPTDLAFSSITSDAAYQSETVSVSDSSGLLVGRTYNLVFGESASTKHNITAIDGNIVSISPSTRQFIPGVAKENSILERALSPNGISLDGTTLRLLVKEVKYNPSDVTLFLQTSNGESIEWDFKPFSEWIDFNLFWLGETAKLTFNGEDTDGDLLPDGTRLDLKVDDKFDTQSTTSLNKKLAENVVAGSDRIYLEDIEDIETDSEYNIISSLHTQSVKIKDIGNDTVGAFVDIYTVLNYGYSKGDDFTQNGISDSQQQIADLAFESKIEVPLPIVDVTPIVAGRNLDPGLLKPYDPVQVPYTETYDNITTNDDYVMYAVKDAPSIDGVVTLRVLPITEDGLKTNQQKQASMESILRSYPLSIPSSQLGQNSVEAVPEETQVVSESDYAIETPVYFDTGIAKSSIVSYATNLEPTDFDGLRMVGSDSSIISLMSKKYDIYPQITVTSETGQTVGRLILSSIPVFFASPIDIDYIDDGQLVYYWKYPPQDDPSGWSKKSIPGTYASSALTKKVTYKITDKLMLADGSIARVKIYKNKIVDLEAIVTGNERNLPSFSLGGMGGGWEGESDEFVYNKKFVNKKPVPRTTVVNGVSTTYIETSDIDGWRNTVANNVAPEKGETDKVNVNGVEFNNEVFGFYLNPAQWQIDENTPKEGYEYEIVNGYITFDMPTSNDVCLWMVEVSVDINSMLEYVSATFIANSNPILINPIEPIRFKPVTGTEKFEFGMEIEWMGGKVVQDGVVVSTDGVIEDGTVLNTPFVAGSVFATIEPRTSRTINGIAGGLFVGPHEPVFCEDVPDEFCFDSSWFVANVSHSSGYSIESRRNVVWQGTGTEEGDEEFPSFLVHVDPISTVVWSDGESQVDVVIDLNSTTNQSVFRQSADGVPIVWVGEFGRDRLMGVDQPNGLPCVITANSYFTPSQQAWTTPVASFRFGPVNKSVGYLQEDIPATFKTSYYYLQDTLYKLNNGEVVASFDEVNAEDVKGVPISITLKEPLAISLEIESYDRLFPRNGTTDATIVATVSWKGKAITPKFTLNEGKPNESVIDYPMPKVQFVSGKCQEQNLYQETSGDKRGPSDACLTVGVDADAILIGNGNNVQTSLSRTDIFNDDPGSETNNSHTHECVVDENGNGITTRTIVLEGTVEDHEHSITGFVSNEINGHTHELRSVAITTLKATANTVLDIVVNGYVTYDPTNCEPYTGWTPTLEVPEEGKNRKAFNSLFLDGFGGDPDSGKLRIRIMASGNFDEFGIPSLDTKESNSPKTFYTAQTIADTDFGFDICAQAYFGEYEANVDGLPVIVPAREVEDGTRISMSVECYKFPDDQLFNDTDATSDVVTITENSSRGYMMLNVKASVYSENQYAEAKQQVLIVSRRAWLPSVKSLVNEPTGDELYKDAALAKINTFGSSQLYDALRLAAQRSLEHVIDNNLPDYKHIIVVLSDGDENASSASLQQAVDNISFIKGVNKTPVVSVKIGEMPNIDSAIMEKIASDTNGFSVGMKELGTLQIEELTSDIITNDKFIVKYGIYSDTIDLISACRPVNVGLNSVTLASNTDIVFRVRTSPDLREWSTWSKWTSYADIATDFPSKQRYVQYEAKLSGNEYFASPSIYNGLSVQYVKPQTSIVYFQPISLDIKNDEYLSSIHITNQGTIPATSTVEYGINMNDSNNPEEFSNAHQEFIRPDQYSIILTRVNELLKTEDSMDYYAVNGAWTEGATIEIRRFNIANSNGVLVQPEEYVLNPSSGNVVFHNLQPNSDFFTITILYNSSFRIICKITNDDMEPATIDYIALMYTIMKRFPRDSDGSILRRPLMKRL